MAVECYETAGETLASKKSAKVSAHETGCSIYGFRTGETLKNSTSERWFCTIIKTVGSQKPAYEKTK
jgi:hypothetical protein